ncbi:hypothetical+protein [Methylocapsa aurea]|jgi:hypothetical protein
MSYFTASDGAQIFYKSFGEGRPIADHRHGAIQAPRRSGEAPGVDDRQKNRQLVEAGGAGIAHFSIFSNS